MWRAGQINSLTRVPDPNIGIAFSRLRRAAIGPHSPGVGPRTPVDLQLKSGAMPTLSLLPSTSIDR